MKAYCIVYEFVDNPEMFEQYRKQVMPTIEAYGGRFVVRGGKFTVLEGEPPCERIAVQVQSAGSIGMRIARSRNRLRTRCRVCAHYTRGAHATSRSRARLRISASRAGSRSRRPACGTRRSSGSSR